METTRGILLNILNVIFGIVGLLLGLRILLRLFAANMQTPAVDWLYNITDGLIAPFQGIFPNITLGGQSVFDVVALISLIAYSIIFYIIAALLRASLHGVSEHEDRIARDRL